MKTACAVVSVTTHTASARRASCRQTPSARLPTNSLSRFSAARDSSFPLATTVSQHPAYDCLLHKWRIKLATAWEADRGLSHERCAHLKGASLSRRRSDSDAIWHVLIASLHNCTGSSVTGRARPSCNNDLISTCKLSKIHVEVINTLAVFSLRPPQQRPASRMCLAQIILLQSRLKLETRE